MLEWLKSAWSRWKVQVSVVGGGLVVATAYGSCTYEPPAVEVSEVVTPSTDSVTIPVSEITNTEETTAEATANSPNTTAEQ